MTDKEFVENIGTVETEELLNLLENIGCDGYYKDLYYPAIEELRKRGLRQRQETDRWIPVSERLPDEYGEYLITGRYGLVRKDIYNSYLGEFNQGKCVIAWKPLPEPYKENKEEDKEGNSVN